MRTDYLKTDYDRGFDAGKRKGRREALEEGVAECARRIILKARDVPERTDWGTWNRATVDCRDAIRALMEKEAD